MPTLALSLVRSSALALIFAATAQIGGSLAQGVEGATSVYTSSADKACKKVSSTKVGDDEYSSQHVCSGIKGFVVIKSETDLRESVSVGATAREAGKEPAAGQTFGAFNSALDTIEWRLDKSGKPFAMIQRWSIADNDDVGKDNRPRSKEFLIVTRIARGSVCHVAYIDSKANGSDANAIARKAADEAASAFDCTKGSITAVGKPGRATALALPSR